LKMEKSQKIILNFFSWLANPSKPELYLPAKDQ